MWQETGEFEFCDRLRVNEPSITEKEKPNGKDADGYEGDETNQFPTAAPSTRAREIHFRSMYGDLSASSCRIFVYAIRQSDQLA